MERDIVPPWLDRSSPSLSEAAILDHLLESSGTPIYVVDEGLRYVRFNLAHATEVAARSKQEVRPGAAVADFLPEEEERSATLDSLRHALTGAQATRSGWVDRGRGKRCSRELRFLPIRGEAGRVVGAMVIARDDPALGRSSAPSGTDGASYQMMFNEAPLGVALVRHDGLILDVNPAYCRFLGSTREKVIGRTVSDITHPEDRGLSPLTALSRGALAGYHLEKRFLRDDGRTVRGRVSAVRLSSQVGLVLGIVEDIDEALPDAAAQRNDDARGRAIFETQPDGVALISREGYVLDANRAFAAQLGWDRDEVIGLHLASFDAGLDPDEMTERLAQCRTGPERFESVHRRADGTTFPVAISLTPMSYGGQSLFCCDVRDISSERSLASQRDTSEARYRALIRRSVNVTYSFSTTRGGLYYSPQVETLLGYTPQELLAHPMRWFAAIHPDDRPMVEAVMARMEREGGFDVELRLRHKDGSWRWIREWSVSVERVGEELVVVGQAMDLTPLREKEAQSARLLDNVPDILYRWNSLPHPHVEYISGAVIRILGYTPAEIIADPTLMTSRFHLEGLPELKATVGPGGVATAPLRIRAEHRDGHTVWLELRRSITCDPTGRPVATEGIARDVTAEVAESHRLAVLGQALEQAAEVAVVTDRDGSIVQVNAAFERITGYSRAEVIGKNPRILRSGAHDRAFYARMWDTLNAGQVWHGAITNRRKDGSQYDAEVVITPIVDDAGQIIQFVGMQRDTSRERMLDEALRQAQKMEAMGQFTGGVAHDFNNMLTVILSNADLIEGELAADSEARTWLTDLTSAARHGSAMVRQLLAFGRQGDLIPRPMRLSTEFNAFIPVLRRLVTEDIEISLAGTDNSWALLDRTVFEQIVLNLATNARDAMPDGGKMVFRIGRREITPDQALASHGALRPGTFATFTVEDTGVGMDKATQLRAFEPFFTTKPVGKGTGLGLAMVHGLMQQQHGWVELHSAPGKGTAITLGFPASSAPVPTAPQAPAATAAGRGGRGELVLVVEDEDSLRRVAARTLEREGYRVITASDGDAGWAQWGEHGEAIDLVLTDAVMPRSSGPDLIRRLRAAGSRVPVILMSGYSAEDLHDPALEGVPVIGKPWSAEVLGQRIRRVLDGDVDD